MPYCVLSPGVDDIHVDTFDVDGVDSGVDEEDVVCTITDLRLGVDVDGGVGVAVGVGDGVAVGVDDGVDVDVGVDEEDAECHH